jgi:hypothetical protein
MYPATIINDLHDFYNNYGGGKYRQYLADFEQAVIETLEAAE